MLKWNYDRLIGLISMFEVIQRGKREMSGGGQGEVFEKYLLKKFPNWWKLKIHKWKKFSECQAQEIGRTLHRGTI